jgi:radical SAM protein (TIGR01212 family)
MDITGSSTSARSTELPLPRWRQLGYRYNPTRLALEQRFGVRVQKISIDAGFTCPNVDGTVAKGGCNFCDNRSFSPSRRLPRAGIVGQLQQSIDHMRSRYSDRRAFLAYFQPATNTYAPVEHLRDIYAAALAHPLVVGLVVGTRPDCVPDPVLDLLDEFAASTYVCVEYGMQTMHDRSLDFMNRGCHHDAMIDAMQRSRGRGFEVSAHLILGLPGESHDDMLASGRELVRLGVDSVKLHNLYCVKNTPLAAEVLAGKVQMMSQDDYIETAIDLIELLPPHMVIERTHGEAPPDYLIAPTWCLDKNAVRNAFHLRLDQRDTWQGRLEQQV